MQPNPMSASDAENANADSSRPYQGTRVGNGYDSVASQYRAIQEAQLLHEETINQLREEVRGQRERLAELARAHPTQKNGPLDVVMLRLSELERKIGEGAPDPLLNEIVHRLAALENNGPIRGMKDPRLDEVQAQLETLRQRVSEASSGDSRTDDVVLRIASLEGAFRRAAQSRDAEEVHARIESLAEELNSRQSKELAELRAGFAALAQSSAEAAAKVSQHDGYSSELNRLSERLKYIEQQLADARSDHRLSEFANQLAMLDRKLAERNNAEIDSRVLALEERVSQDPARGELENIGNRVGALENKLLSPVADGALERLQDLESRLARVEDPSAIAALRERVAALTAEIEDSGPARRLLELSGRVRGLETRLDAQPAPESTVQDLRDHLARLEHSVASGPSVTDLLRLEAQLATLKTVAEAGSALPSDLAPRLAELESRFADAETSSRLEDADARLGSIESKLNTLGEPAEISRRLTVLEMDASPALDPRVDDLLHRLAALESKPFESLSDNGLLQLKESVADLHAELETVSNERLPVLTELPERLARLEARMREALEQATFSQGQAEPSKAIQEQVLALSDRVEMLAAKPAPSSLQDPRVSELVARLEWIERNGVSSSAPADVDVDALQRRVEAIEHGLSSGRTGGSMSAGVQAELAARLHAIEDALDCMQTGDRPDSAGELALALQKETDRLTQWARGAMQEIADLRERIEAPGASRPAFDAESLAVEISNGLNNSEAKALRGQMYFVFLALGVLWTLLMYALFTS